MLNKYPAISAAVAVALAGNAHAALPTLAQAANPTVKLVMAGSSAAQPVIAGFIQHIICGSTSNTLVMRSAGASKNFYAYSCFIPTALSDPIGFGASLAANTLVTIFYRAEGDSFVGVVPIIANRQIKRLNLADVTCTGITLSCTVNGVLPASATGDTWTQAVVNDTVQLGVTDVEPSLFTGSDYGTAFNTTAFGQASSTQLKNWIVDGYVVPAFQQVYGLAVNTVSQGFSAVNLTRASAANILDGVYQDWSSVPDGNTGIPITPVSHPIHHVDLVNGSGIRAAANIHFLNYHCRDATSFIPNRAGETLSYSTTDALTLANATPGSITYTNIDNLVIPANAAHYPNLVLASLDGVAPGNLLAATDKYRFWFESTFVLNPLVSANSQTATLANFIQGNAPDIISFPADPGVNAIPFAGLVGNNNPALPVSSSTNGLTPPVYISPNTHNGDSCSIPLALN